jgi:regulator of sirC expression with transglutaminase-like and TPR domain
MEAGRWTEAHIAFDRALFFDPSETSALVNRATLLVRAGDVEGALRDLDAVLARGEDTTARANREKILLASPGARGNLSDGGHDGA